MLLASLQNVTREYGAQTVLDGVSFKMSSGEKLGLIGPNGSGKTTILRILLGKEPPSTGEAVLSRGTRLGYVPQYAEYNENQTVMESLLAHHRRLADSLRRAEHRLAEAAPGEMDKALRAYQRARDAYDHAGGDSFPGRAKATLDALGLPGRENQNTSQLSGGEKNVLSLAGALLDRPDLLVLDEPANHLDYSGLTWLESFLAKFKGALLVVSHNRYLLDRVVSGVLHLERGRVKYYHGGYSTYRATRLRDLIAQQTAYTANQKRLARLEALVKKFADIARSHSSPAWGKRLRARRSQLEREKRDAVDKPLLGDYAIRADFQVAPTRANVALQIRDYSKAFGDLKLFENAHLEISCGERVALVGPNGSGKTTLLREIVENAAWENPHFRIGPSLAIGYCAQEQELLRDDATVIDDLVSSTPVTQREAPSLLARFLFTWDDLTKRVSDLSGGEKNRLQLARLMAERPNFLILDEPTNHLDITAREAVEEALDDFDGTLLVVSHDRYFLDKMVNRVVEVRDRRLVSYDGNFTDFFCERQASLPRTSARVAKRRKERRRPSGTSKASKLLADLEKRIHETEKKKLDLERRITEAFTNHDAAEGHKASRQLQRIRSQLDDLYNKWMSETP